MKKIIVVLLVFFCGFGSAAAQVKRKTPPRKAPAAQVKPAELIFAVLNDGTVIEPFAKFDAGELLPLSSEALDGAMLNKFAADFYKPRTNYKLVFGGVDSGTVTVKNSNTKSDCSKISANVSFQSAKFKPKGLVMALATNTTLGGQSSGVRRLPTPAERREIESLVRDEFKKQKAGKAALDTINYHNLTAVDADNDGVPEMIGSFWSQNGEGGRDLLFFIAEKSKGGKYKMGFSRFDALKADDVMSGDFKDVDKSAMLNELFLDLMEFNGGNSDEVFTVTKGFEGYSYRAYSRLEGKWQKVFESYSYHCAF